MDNLIKTGIEHVGYFITPSSKDMELITNHGVLSWLVIYWSKFLGVLLILWLLVTNYEIQPPIKKRHKV